MPKVPTGRRFPIVTPDQIRNAERHSATRFTCGRRFCALCMRGFGSAANHASGCVDGDSKRRHFGGKPRFFGPGLLSFGVGITGFVVSWIEIASLRAPGWGRAGCIGRIEGKIHPAAPPQEGGGPGSLNHGPLRNVPMAASGWRWQRAPSRLVPAARVASDAAAGDDGCSPGHARSPHAGGSIRGDVRDVPARCRTSNSTGGHGRNSCTGRPDACTDNN